MNETPKQYTTRLLGYIKGRKPLGVLKTTPGKVRSLMKKAARAKMQKRPKPGRWSAAEIIAHLAESELVIGYRLRKVLEKSGTPIQAYEQDDWQKNAGYLHRNPGEALELFAVLRKNNLALISSIPRSKWKNYGVHSERGKESVAQMVDLYAGHDINHLRQLQPLLK